MDTQSPARAEVNATDNTPPVGGLPVPPAHFSFVGPEVKGVEIVSVSAVQIDTCHRVFWLRGADLNRRPRDYMSRALPLRYPAKGRGQSGARVAAPARTSSSATLTGTMTGPCRTSTPSIITALTISIWT